MVRSKFPQTGPKPRPDGSWLLGMMIGSTIISLATGAMVLGAGMAVKDAGLKGG